ncbi:MULTISPECIES: DUF3616 domain-containing protein [Bradyrhizobium]|jgi:hypothetical protein|uniref:DUF3616 domain-containing protein n=1 Tax=Bradyrhizobium TaxID=374 RepID=UPI0006859FA0|nr:MULTISPECIES: DUF3616 domain-containing protein [Bradyrhizobium]MBP2428963.1 hypothetical protein [Bradyrhizobium elkanii]MCP1972172.1 hypothetical protein [Bradyrhizobium elkanii]MCS3452434.1 hypothetical protein [Bradyrhizobium elkanii]MCS3565463.1 hypothetical protein [Bradyrhizobium elkanii]MCS4106318.1 hypothetical protein [Bradyrhizobium elkanii]
MSKIIRRNALAALAVIATVVPFSLRATSVRSSALQVAVPLTDDKGKPSNDISGISCLEPQGGKRTCVVIDDQGRLAQVATVEASTLTGQAKIRLIGKAHAPVDIAGTEPGIDPKVVKCSAGKDDFKDLDGEAVALDDKFFYVVGSHGCSRNSNKFRTSSFILARVPIDVVRTASGAPNNVDTIGPKSTSYRLSEALLASPTLKDHYALDLMTKNGLNIEGLAVAGGKLYVGLRAPVIGKKAYLVAVDRDWLFDASRPVAQADIREIDLDLGGRGIRDLAVMADGRLLALGGPAQSDDFSFALYAVEPASKTATPIAELVDVPDGGKAEALQILAQAPTTLDLLVLFDSAKGGAPRRYLIDLK